MKATVIVDNLLEAFDAKDFLDQALNFQRQEQIEKLPKPLRPVFAQAPEGFLSALGDPDRSASWRVPGNPPWWPLSYGGSPRIWSKHRFYTVFDIMKGALFMRVMRQSDEGTHTVFHDKFSQGYRRVQRKAFSTQKWLSRMIDYEIWVIENDRDPLRFFQPLKKRQEEWTVHVARDGENVRFEHATSNDGQATTRFEELPAIAKNFFNDMNLSWDEMIRYAKAEVVYYNEDEATLIFKGEALGRRQSGLEAVVAPSLHAHQEELSRIRNGPVTSEVVP